MPTATSAKPAKAKAKATSKARAKAAGARAHSTQAKAASARTASAKSRPTQNGSRDTGQLFGDYAERAVLIPVGAALYARDRVVSTVSDTVSTYSSATKAQKEIQQQLRRFERRGATARNRLERELRKARVRVERELRQRRRRIERSVSDLEERRDAFAKNVGELPNRIPELASQAQERILNLV